MNNKEIYKVWAPKTSIWSAWVRPVLFLDIDKAEDRHFTLPDLHPDIKYKDDTVYFIDLPKDDGVLMGMKFLELGYRPIALYNASPSPTKSFSLVDNTSIQEAIKWSTKLLKEVTLPLTALPVFLLDSNRILRHKFDKSVFDNSWDLYDQDIPSPKFLKDQNIKNIVIYGDEVHRDLKKIFYEFQTKGFKIYHTVGAGDMSLLSLKKPPKKDKFH